MILQLKISILFSIKIDLGKLGSVTIVLKIEIKLGSQVTAASFLQNIRTIYTDVLFALTV